MSFMIAFIPLSIPVSWVIDTYGFRLAVGIGAVMMGIFGIMRGMAGTNYTLVLLSTFGIAAAQPFLLNTWTKVPANWFALEERATAVGMVTLASLVGTALGMVLTPILMESLSISTIQLYYGGIAAVSAILFIALSRETPPTPPCPPGHGSPRFDVGRLETCINRESILVRTGDHIYRAGYLQRHDHLGREHHPSARIHTHRSGHTRRIDDRRRRDRRSGHSCPLR